MVSPWKYRELLRNLVRKDLKVRYQGSALGFAWSLITPFAMIIIFSVAFTFILRIHLENFTLFLVAGLLPWNFFSAAAMTSTDAITSNSNLIKKIYFPREILPVSTVLFNFIHFLLALLVFLPVMVFLEAPFDLQFLALPLVLALHLGFAIGIAFFLSSTTVFLRDIRHLTDLGLMALFWLTPVVYDITMVPDQYVNIYRLGPVTPFIVAYHDIIYWGLWPARGTWLLMVAWTMATLIVGRTLFRFLQGRFAEEL